MAKKIRTPQRHIYKGYIIKCHGYYPPEKRVVWEGIDPKSGCADYHAYSKRDLINLIDKDNENN